ncbi:hypothetical protein [Streptomyces uncialis]|uniref:hypothetical protein n=1 Tax=Streptomyces uncialis TaxID=1048205 RepID=UPI0038667425|nr:hypothetical protein OG268_17905 [Streptomyces uncialis]
MKFHHMTRVLSAGLIAAVLTLASVLGRPMWVWFLLPALVAGALLLDFRAVGFADSTSPDDDTSADDPQPSEEKPWLQTSLVVVPVQSVLPDCPFLLSATVWWRPVDPLDPLTQGNPAGLATMSVLERAQNVVGAEHPGRCTFLEHWLTGVLGRPTPDHTASVTAFAADVRLVLRPADQRHLDELDGLRKSMDTAESRRQHERDLRTYLREDVLETPGSALVWWMARHDDEIERAVRMIAPLTYLSAAANDEEVPEAFRDLLTVLPEGDPTGGFEHPEPVDERATAATAAGEGHRSVGWETSPGERVSDLLDQMGFAQGSADRAAFVHRLARMSDEAGRSDAAESFRANLRREQYGEEQLSAEAHEDGAEETTSATGNGHPSPPYAGPEAVRTGEWQVTTDGQVSQVDLSDSYDPGHPTPGAPGAGPAGAEQ